MKQPEENPVEKWARSVSQAAAAVAIECGNYMKLWNLQEFAP